MDNSKPFTHKLLLLAFVLFMSSSCGQVTTKHVLVKDPIQIEIGKKIQPLEFSKVVIKVKRNEKIGKLMLGPFCHPRDLKWRSSGRSNVTSDDFTEVFRDE